MSDEEKKQEKEVFDQELSLDELDAAAGGLKTSAPIGEVWGLCMYNSISNAEDDTSNCENYTARPIYGGGGFPNCAATVEDGSWCKYNDACYKTAIDYRGLTDCAKAWR